MKTVKLLFKITLCLVPLWFTMGYTAFSYDNYGNDMIIYNLWHKKMCRSKELKKYNLIALGDSVANAAYVPDYISEDFINLSIPQATPVEIYFVLKEILKIHKPSTIFISFMNHHLAGTMNGWFTERLFSHRFDFITEAKIMNYARKHKTERSMFPKHYFLEWLSYRLYLPSVFIPSLLNSSFNTRKKSNKQFKKMLDLHRGTFISRTTKENIDNSRVTWKSYSLSDLQKKFYKKILQLCNEQNIKVKIVILPLNPKVSETYLKQRDTLYADLTAGYSDVEVVQPFINLSSTDFHDTHHLNIHGSFKFSTALRDRYKDIFSSPENQQPSERTISGREDYITLENEYSTLLMRIEDPFYAIIFNPQGNLSERIRKGDLNIKGIKPYQYDNLFLLNRDKLDNLSLNPEQKYIEFSLGKKRKDIGRWQIADIHVIIVNKKKNEIVAEKRFVFKDRSLKAIK